jgi:tyrosyl-tRNA synthetase
VGLSDAPDEMFGKIMSISDETMLQYYTLLTLEDLDAVKAKHPMQAKKDLAYLLTKRFHRESGAEAGKAHFEKVFSKKENPDEMPSFRPAPGATISSVLIDNGIAKSKNEARRLIDQGAVKIDGSRVESDVVINVVKETVLQAGKRHFLKLIR